MAWQRYAYTFNDIGNPAATQSGGNSSRWTYLILQSHGLWKGSGDGAGEGLEAFTYDANGNLTSDGRWDYTWDVENRLIQMATKSGVPGLVMCE